jgi:hypothetical protein
MIVERWTQQEKPVKFEEALSLAKEGRDDIWSFIPCRILTSNVGPRNIIIIEHEFKDFAERDELQGKLLEKENWGPWLERWVKATTRQSVNDIWSIE